MATDATRLAYRTCNLCEACCGLEFTISGTTIKRITGDPADSFSKGYCCPKGLAMRELHHDPDRLHEPLVRDRRGKLVPSTWEHAILTAARGLSDVYARYGKNAIGHYIGNPVVHHLTALMGTEILRRILPTRNRYSANSQDANPQLLANYLMFGGQLIHPVPDLDRGQFLVVLGANPLASNGSLLTAPGIGSRLRGIQRRGGEIWVIDPRRTRTADLADRHLAIEPESDALLLLAIVHTVLAEGLEDQALLGQHARRRDVTHLRELVGPFSPDNVAKRLGPDLDAHTVRELARRLAREPRAALYARVGICLSRFAGLASWAVNVVNLVCGNIDRIGGLLFPRGLGEMLDDFAEGSYDRYRSPQGAPEISGEYPCRILADQMERGAADPHAEQAISAMVVMAGNPVLSAPNGPRLREAFSKLKFMVAVDIYPSETAQLANVVLPPRSPLYDVHADFVFGQLSVERFFRVSPALLPPPVEGLNEFEILKRLAQETVRDLPKRKRSWKQLALAKAADHVTVERFADALIRFGPYGDNCNPFSAGLNLKKVLAAPHGLPAQPLEPGRLGDRLRTEDGRISLIPAPMVRDLARLEGFMNEAPDRALSLIGRRMLKTNNSWFHNLVRLRRADNACTLQMHPRDAAAQGLTDGDDVEIRSRVGSVVAPLAISDRVMPGVVSLPHGFGHAAHGGRVASGDPGVSANDLTDETRFCPMTGNAALNGVPVTVTRIGSSEAEAAAAPIEASLATEDAPRPLASAGAGERGVL